MTPAWSSCFSRVSHNLKTYTVCILPDYEHKRACAYVCVCVPLLNVGFQINSECLCKTGGLIPPRTVLAAPAQPKRPNILINFFKLRLDSFVKLPKLRDDPLVLQITMVTVIALLFAETDEPEVLRTNVQKCLESHCINQCVVQSVNLETSVRQMPDNRRLLRTSPWPSPHA